MNTDYDRLRKSLSTQNMKVNPLDSWTNPYTKNTILSGLVGFQIIKTYKIWIGEIVYSPSCIWEVRT